MTKYAPVGIALGFAYILYQIASDERARTLPSTDRVILTATIFVVAMIGISATVITAAIRSRKP